VGKSRAVTTGYISETLHTGICGIDGECNSLIELLVGSLAWPESPLLSDNTAWWQQWWQKVALAS